MSVSEELRLNRQAAGSRGSHVGIAGTSLTGCRIVTMAAGRGIGTYSMKLLIETDLGGHVSFISRPDIRTIFSIMIPLTYPRH